MIFVTWSVPCPLRSSMERSSMLLNGINGEVYFASTIIVLKNLKLLVGLKMQWLILKASAFFCRTCSWIVGRADSCVYASLNYSSRIQIQSSCTIPGRYWQYRYNQDKYNWSIPIAQIARHRKARKFYHFWVPKWSPYTVSDSWIDRLIFSGRVGVLL